VQKYAIDRQWSPLSLQQAQDFGKLDTISEIAGKLSEAEVETAYRCQQLYLGDSCFGTPLQSAGNTPMASPRPLQYAAAFFVFVTCDPAYQFPNYASSPAEFKSEHLAVRA
jgi:hypothetical protein